MSEKEENIGELKTVKTKSSRSALKSGKPRSPGRPSKKLVISEKEEVKEIESLPEYVLEDIARRKKKKETKKEIMLAEKSKIDLNPTIIKYSYFPHIGEYLDIEDPTKGILLYSDLRSGLSKRLINEIIEEFIEEILIEKGYIEESIVHVFSNDSGLTALPLAKVFQSVNLFTDTKNDLLMKTLRNNINGIGNINMLQILGNLIKSTIDNDDIIIVTDPSFNLKYLTEDLLAKKLNPWIIIVSKNTDKFNVQADKEIILDNLEKNKYYKDATNGVALSLKASPSNLKVSLFHNLNKPLYKLRSSEPSSTFKRGIYTIDDFIYSDLFYPSLSNNSPLDRYYWVTKQDLLSGLNINQIDNIANLIRLNAPFGDKTVNIISKDGGILAIGLSKFANKIRLLVDEENVDQLEAINQNLRVYQNEPLYQKNIEVIKVKNIDKYIPLEEVNSNEVLVLDRSISSNIKQIDDLTERFKGKNIDLILLSDLKYEPNDYIREIDSKDIYEYLLKDDSTMGIGLKAIINQGLNKSRFNLILMKGQEENTNNILVKQDLFESKDFFDERVRLSKYLISQNPNIGPEVIQMFTWAFIEKLQTGNIYSKEVENGLDYLFLK